MNAAKHPTKQNRSALAFTTGLLLLGLTIGMLITALHAPFFTIGEIVVSGNLTVSSGEVKRLAAVPAGANIFLVNEREVVSRVLLHPMIRSVTINRSLPSTLNIKVREREPVALLPVAGGFLVIDETASYMKQVGSVTEESLPVVTGVQPPSEFLPGQRLEHPELQAFLPVLKEINPSASKEISEISLHQANDLRIYTMGRIEIRVGTADHLVRSRSTLEDILMHQLLTIGDRRIEYIDMSFEGVPVIKFQDQG